MSPNQIDALMHAMSLVLRIVAMCCVLMTGAYFERVHSGRGLGRDMTRAIVFLIGGVLSSIVFYTIAQGIGR